jgi:hypothetical protein
MKFFPKNDVSDQLPHIKYDVYVFISLPQFTGKQIDQLGRPFTPFRKMPKELIVIRNIERVKLHQQLLLHIMVKERQRNEGFFVAVPALE